MLKMVLKRVSFFGASFLAAINSVATRPLETEGAKAEAVAKAATKTQVTFMV
jgi:hypothetical protein